MTYQAVAFRPDNGNSGDFFGDGQSGVQGRIPACPCMKIKAGTCCTSAFRAAGATERTISPTRTTPATQLRLQARPELRDDDPAGGGGATPSTTPTTTG